MTFSRPKDIIRAKKHKIRRAISQVSGSNPSPDIALAHPEWVREAQSKKYTSLIKQIGEDFDKKLVRTLARRNKLAGK